MKINICILYCYSVSCWVRGRFMTFLKNKNAVVFIKVCIFAKIDWILYISCKIERC